MHNATLVIVDHNDANTTKEAIAAAENILEPFSWSKNCTCEAEDAESDDCTCFNNCFWDWYCVGGSWVGAWPLIVGRESLGEDRASLGEFSYRSYTEEDGADYSRAATIVQKKYIDLNKIAAPHRTLFDGDVINTDVFENPLAVALGAEPKTRPMAEIVWQRVLDESHDDDWFVMVDTHK